MGEQMTLDGQAVVKQLNLSCYLVGDHDYYAAESAGQALRLHIELHEMEEDEEDEVCLVVGALLDKGWQDEENPGVSAGTLRQWLAEATEPGWLNGTE